MAVFNKLKAKAITIAANKAIDLLYEDFDANLPKIRATLDRFLGSGDETSDEQIGIFDMVMDHLETPGDNWRQLVQNVIANVDRDVARTFAINFFVNSVAIGGPRQREVREKYGCNSPWAILMDPTTACNLHCTGCWAANYTDKKQRSLTFEELDSIITQGKELGTYIYLYTGGEPMLRKRDIIRLCELHPDCFFSAFTNGTLIDEAFADEMLRVKNFVPAISLEGFEEATDSRRGDGVYQKVMHAMELLHDRKLLYGISSCYTSVNYDSITSEAYYDKLIEMGAYFIWYFHYMPVGNDASPELLPTPEQRELVYRRIRDYRVRKPLFAMDFQNDAEYVGGCIAGGRRYFHINANGDIDPCVFVHYSDSNIREKTLLEAMQSPLFQAYHDGQPFNENMLQPCPMLENPTLLRGMIEKTGAKSTDMQSPETADHLCSKCDHYADCWKPKAESLWSDRQAELAAKQAQNA